MEPLLLALSIACGLDPKFRWPTVPEGQEVGDVEDWNVGLVHQCVQAAAECNKEPERVIKEARREADSAAFHQRLRRQVSELRAAAGRQGSAPCEQGTREDHALRDLSHKEYNTLIRNLENSQRARANSLPPPIRFDVQET